VLIWKASGAALSKGGRLAEGASHGEKNPTRRNQHRTPLTHRLHKLKYEMEPNSKPSKKESKFRRFLHSGLKRKEKPKASPIPIPAADASVVDAPAARATVAPFEVSNEALSTPLLESGIVPAVEPQTPKATLTPTDQSELVTPEVEHKDSTGADHEEILPTSVALAKERLDKAGEELRKKIPQGFLEGADFEIKASADINSLADNVGGALVAMMELRKIKKSKQSRARGFVTEWAKKTIPLVGTGLTVVNVHTLKLEVY
jgi:hypothetical protein